MAKKIKPKKLGEFYTEAPTIERDGVNYYLKLNGEQVGTKTYRNLYIAQQALIEWVTTHTKAPKFNKTEKTQIADNEQKDSD